MRAHDGSLDLVCTQQRILKILKITGLTDVGHLLEAGHAAWRVTAQHGHDCLAGLEGERPRTVEETDQSVHA